MIHREDFDKTRERFKALWNREIIDRCCVSVPIQIKASLRIFIPFLKIKWIRSVTGPDGEWILMRNLDTFENTYYGGDAFPLAWLIWDKRPRAFLKNVGHQYMPDTIWFNAKMEDELEPEKISFDCHAFLYEKNFRNFSLSMQGS